MPLQRKEEGISWRMDKAGPGQLSLSMFSKSLHGLVYAISNKYLPKNINKKTKGGWLVFLHKIQVVSNYEEPDKICKSFINRAYIALPPGPAPFERLRLQCPQVPNIKNYANC